MNTQKSKGSKYAVYALLIFLVYKCHKHVEKDLATDSVNRKNAVFKNFREENKFKNY